MYWTLVVLTLSGTPIPTGMSYSSLDACYAAEDKMAAEYSRYYNDWAGRNKPQVVPDFMRQRLMRGVCVPHDPKAPESK